MTISIQTGPSVTTVHFVLPEVYSDDPVSVVGSFNGWTPGADPLLPQPDGTIKAIVRVTTKQDIHFRYLDSAGTWFDDPDAHEITAHGGVLHLDSAEQPESATASDESKVSATPTEPITE